MAFFFSNNDKIECLCIQIDNNLKIVSNKISQIKIGHDFEESFKKAYPLFAHVFFHITYNT